MKLTAPNGKKIAFILLEDGSKSTFTFSASRRGENTEMSYTLPADRPAEIMFRDGDRVLIDEDGGEWPATDVEYHCAGTF